MAVERAHERALAALGAQVGVHLEAGLAQDPHHPAREPGGGGVGGLRDEHDVDVADVVQLAAAALAHRDDREPAGPCSPSPASATATASAACSAARREVRQPRGDLLHAQHRQVGLGDGRRGRRRRAPAARRGTRCAGPRRPPNRSASRCRHPPTPAGGASGLGADRREQGRGELVPAPAPRCGRRAAGASGRGAARGGRRARSSCPARRTAAPAGPTSARSAASNSPSGRCSGGDEPLDAPEREVGVGAAGERPHDLLRALGGRSPAHQPSW